MSSVVGRLYMCDRCGATTFSKRTPISEVSVTHDKCIKDVEQFMPRDASWGYVTRVGDLCPNCLNKFKEFMEDFMYGKT